MPASTGKPARVVGRASTSEVSLGFRPEILAKVVLLLRLLVRLLFLLRLVPRGTYVLPLVFFLTRCLLLFIVLVVRVVADEEVILDGWIVDLDAIFHGHAEGLAHLGQNFIDDSIHG